MPAYLKELLDELARREQQTGRLHTVREAALSISPTTPRGGGKRWPMAPASSPILPCWRPAMTRAGRRPGPRRPDGLGGRHGARSGRRVLVLGTGLSMVDAFLALEAARPSRRSSRCRGAACCRPARRANRSSSMWPTFHSAPSCPISSSWFRDLVRENQKRRHRLARRSRWPEAVQPGIWQNWPSSRQARFVEHAKAWWDIHRHRMAPEVYAHVTAGRCNRARIRPDRRCVVSLASHGGDGYTVEVQSPHSTTASRNTSKPPASIVFHRH